MKIVTVIVLLSLAFLIKAATVPLNNEDSSSPRQKRFILAGLAGVGLAGAGLAGAGLAGIGLIGAGIAAKAGLGLAAGAIAAKSLSSHYHYGRPRYFYGRIYGSYRYGGNVGMQEGMAMALMTVMDGKYELE